MVEWSFPISIKCYFTDFVQNSGIKFLKITLSKILSYKTKYLTHREKFFKGVNVLIHRMIKGKKTFSCTLLLNYKLNLAFPSSIFCPEPRYHLRDIFFISTWVMEKLFPEAFDAFYLPSYQKGSTQPRSHSVFKQGELSGKYFGLLLSVNIRGFSS